MPVVPLLQDQGGAVSDCMNEPCSHDHNCHGCALAPSGRKDDAHKLPYDLVPVEAEEELVRVLAHGAAKYAPNNWRKVDRWRERYYAAARRHMNEWRGGEQRDPESGLHHLAHAMCSIMFILTLEMEEQHERANR